MGAHFNRLGEAILMSTHYIGFYEDLTKIIFELSSNIKYHLISSTETKIRLLAAPRGATLSGVPKFRTF